MKAYCVVVRDDAEAEFDREVDYSAARWGVRHAMGHAKTLRTSHCKYFKK